MHHKYVVRDGSDVWTGSTNWSDDSWSREENVIAVVHSDELAARYTEDFEQLWETESVEKSGFVEPNPIRVGDAKVRAWFSPGHGEALATRIAHRIAKAKRRIRICSPVMTSGPVLGALAEAVSDGKCDVAGRRRRHPDEGRLPPVGAERELGVEDARDQTHLRERALHREELDALRPGGRPRLHARQGRGRRRLPLHGELQPLPFGRAERRKRPRGRETLRWPTSSRRSWTRSTRSTRPPQFPNRVFTRGSNEGKEIFS